MLREGPAGLSALLVGLKLGAFGILRFAVPLAPEAAREYFWLMAGPGPVRHAVWGAGGVAAVQPAADAGFLQREPRRPGDRGDRRPERPGRAGRDLPTGQFRDRRGRSSASRRLSAPPPGLDRSGESGRSWSGRCPD
ncbi:MAG: hypothetical protein MZV63_19380 [Marinilabiliales bacterium]|nr:hypothetical protein [Marinilabiliales bacterium]